MKRDNKKVPDGLYHPGQTSCDHDKLPCDIMHPGLPLQHWELPADDSRRKEIAHFRIEEEHVPEFITTAPKIQNHFPAGLNPHPNASDLPVQSNEPKINMPIGKMPTNSRE